MRKSISIFLSILLLVSICFPYASSVQAATITDIKKNDSKYAAINWAVDNGLMSLYTGNKFDSNGNVTEAQLLGMFAKLDANYKYSNVADMFYNYYGDLNIPLEGAMSNAKRNSLVSRGDFAVIYAAMKGLDLTEVYAVQYLYTQEITTGSAGKKTYEDYKPSKNLTRGDVAVFLYRSVKKGQLAVEGLVKEASGKDNNKITLPINFVKNNGSAVELEKPTPSTNDISPNTVTANKAVQSIKVENKKLIANGLDTTMISIQLKDSNGKAIPYTKSLKFKVTSEYFGKMDLDKILNDTSSNKEIYQTATAVTSPTGPATIFAYSDGGDLTFFFRAPKVTKSLKDNIIVELVDEVDSNYASYKNSQIKIPVEYIPEPELRITYEVFDATVGEYVGGENGGVDQSPITYPSLKQGPITISAINPDKKTFTLTSSNQDTSLSSIIKNPVYEYAYFTLAGYEISEQMFERIVQDYFEIGKTKTITLDYYLDSKGSAAYNIPFGVIPSQYINMFSSSDPQSYAVLMYLIDLLPSDISKFSMADYKSVKSAESIILSLTTSEINNTNLSKYRNKLNGLLALAELADKTLLDEQAANRPENSKSYTKIMVSLVAPGGQVITNYKGRVDIVYNGQTKTTPFNTNTANVLDDSGHKGVAVAYFEGLVYGESTVTAKLSDVEADDRYKTLLKGLKNKEINKEVLVHPPIIENVCYSDMEVAYLIDESGSMNKVDPTNLVQSKTLELIRNIEASPSIAASFNTEGKLYTKGESQSVSKYPNLYSISNRGGGSSMLNGLKIAASYFESDATDRSIQRIVILVSDGKTTNAELTKMANYAKERGFTIYTVAIGKQTDANQTFLKNLASETDGKYFSLTNINNISNVYNSIMQSLCGASPSCSLTNAFAKSEVVILRQSIFIEAEANCENMESVKVKFYSVNGEFEYNLKYIGKNMFELEYDIRKIHNFSIYEEVEFFAYDKSGKLLGNKKVKIQ